MNAERWRRVQEVFLDALGSAEPERSGLLDRSCGDDDELRREVDALLTGHRRAPGFIEPAPGPDSVGRQVGEHTLTRLLGVGGMGAVYEAEQLKPRRRVALKLFRSWLADDGARRRFEDEAALLARLRHPNIAQVFQTGVHRRSPDDAGSPYFTMELVEDARTIIEAGAGRPLEARLSLFLRTCDAVHHGHQRGIVHRDIKPGNILVGSDDQPKIIDFGVARLTDADVEATRRTAAGQLVGTLAYMSPEQCEGDPLEIDTRSDVYALGLVLFELLCGRRPYEVSGKPLAEAARLITSVPPARPRQFEPRLPVDLETVVLKALEKDKSRRYQSAADLARDIRRFLAHEPIEARPVSAIRHLRLFARRNRAGVLAIAGVALALLVGAIFSFAFALQARRQSEEATVAKDRERLERIGAEQATVALEEFFSAADPFKFGPDARFREVVAAWSQRVESALKDRPLALASAKYGMGVAYAYTGRPREGIAMLESSLETRRRLLPHRPAMIARTRAALALACERADEDQLAIDEFQAVIAECLQVQGEDRPEADTIRARALNSLGMVFDKVTRFQDARTHLVEAVALMRALDMHPRELAAALANLGSVEYHLAGKAVAAETAWLEALAVFRASGEASDPNLAALLGNLATAQMERGALDEAEQSCREAIAVGSLRYQPADPIVIAWRQRLATIHLRRKQYDLAEPQYLEVAAALRAAGRAESSAMANLQTDLGLCRFFAGRLDDAEEPLREALRLLGGVASGRADAMTAAAVLGSVLVSRGRPAEARPLLQGVVEFRRAALSPGHPMTANAESVLGECLVGLGQIAEAEPLVLSGYDGLRAGLPASDQRVVDARRRVRAYFDAAALPDRWQAWVDAHPD